MKIYLKIVNLLLNRMQLFENEANKSTLQIKPKLIAQYHQTELNPDQNQLRSCRYIFWISHYRSPVTNHFQTTLQAGASSMGGWGDASPNILVGEAGGGLCFIPPKFDIGSISNRLRARMAFPKRPCPKTAVRKPIIKSQNHPIPTNSLIGRRTAVFGHGRFGNGRFGMIP
jgi:hypothetical protein